MRRLVLGLVVCIMSCGVNAWNATGHLLVAQIAYDNLTPQAKQLVERYNDSLNGVFPAGDFVQSSTWLDSLRSEDVHWFNALHYIDKPFAYDGTPLPKIAKHNAAWAIRQAIKILQSNKASDSEKALSLRILVHTVGDVHQPLHTASLVSQHHPRGDKGGRLFPLSNNPIGKDLHTYWDKGGGMLMGYSTELQIRNKAHQLETQWPCQSVTSKQKPYKWIADSHQLAKYRAYIVAPRTQPSKRYQLQVQNTSQRQIQLAGCRLAYVLNTIVSTSS